MATTDTDGVNTQECIARQLLTQSPGLFVGVDGDGAAHYWDSLEWTVAVVPADARTTADAETHALPRDRSLGAWCEFVRDRRGWDVGPHVGGSLADDLLECLR